MSYLIYNDYKKAIQALNLSQIISNDLTILMAWQLAAQEECMSYLRQKFDVGAEFTDSTAWSPTKIYKAKDRVYLDAPAFDESATYNLRQLTLNDGNVYICSTAVDTPGPFDVTNWSLLGVQYTIYYVGLPLPEFVFAQYYNTGDQVFWKDKSYTALRGSTTYDAIQFPTMASIPPMNLFPDAIMNGNSNQQWGIGTPYSVAAGTSLSNPVWVQGDNRSQQMVEKCIDIVLYRAHSRISPNNVPDLRHNNYLNAISWLKQCAVGDITPTLPVLQPRQGARIRLGGSPKQQNGY